MANLFRPNPDAPLSNSQVAALKAIAAKPASFNAMLACGATGIACVSLVKRGWANVSTDTGEKLWTITEAGLKRISTLV